MTSFSSQFQIHLLGPPDIRLGDKLLVFPTRKTLALLVYLALEQDEQPRQRLAAFLWPESSPERSHASLRNTLGHLQMALRLTSGEQEDSYLSITHNTLALKLNSNIDLDLQTVERAYTQARSDRSSRVPPQISASLPLLQSAAACYRGDFLAGFSLGDAPDFDDWVDIQREVWRRRLGLVLDRLTEIQFASGEFTSATETASRWIALDPLNEVPYRLKMRAHLASGERGQALETYELCRSVLASELQLEPEPDTEALAALVRLQRARPSPIRRPDTPAAFLEALFAGRMLENQALVERYRRTAVGQPQFVLLRGEIGIGKTRLAKAFMDWAKGEGAEILPGGSFESGSHMPFQPLVEALRLRLEQEPSLADMLEEVWLFPLSQLLPELRQHTPGPAPAPLDRLAPKEQPHLEAEISQSQLFEPIVHVTLALAKRAPLVLFLDDLQWSDSATLDLLQYAIRRWRESSARVLLLASLRSEALLPLTQPQQAGGPAGLVHWLARMEHELPATHLELQPLGEAETVQMVNAILAPPAPDFAQWVFDETHGQPFYLMETLKDLLERRALHPKRRAKSQWTFTVDAEHDLGKSVRVPSTVRAVIRSRLDRLSPNAFTLLAASAILEQRITFERLVAIAKVSEDLALPALDELVSGRLLLEVVQMESASTFSFANDILRDVVYTEAGDARRRLFHRRALEILENAGVSAAVLAHHALAGGQAQATFRHSLAAGQEAMRLSAVSEAIVHFERARRFLREGGLPETPSGSDLRDLYMLLGRAYERNGQPEQASKAYDELEQKP